MNEVRKPGLKVSRGREGEIKGLIYTKALRHSVSVVYTARRPVGKRERVVDEGKGGLRSCSGRDNCKDFGFYSK